MRRLYHTLAASMLMRRMERRRTLIARDSTMWAHHMEQASLKRVPGTIWPVCVAACVVACFCVATVLFW